MLSFWLPERFLRHDADTYSVLRRFFIRTVTAVKIPRLRISRPLITCGWIAKKPHATASASARSKTPCVNAPKTAACSMPPVLDSAVPVCYNDNNYKM